MFSSAADTTVVLMMTSTEAGDYKGLTLRYSVNGMSETFFDLEFDLDPTS